MTHLCECGCGHETPIARYTDKKSGVRKGEPTRFLFRHQCKMTGARHANWRGGRKQHGTGYIEVMAPDHPRASPSGYVLEHILVAERALGKPLVAPHQIHHVDRDRARNVGGNLVICEDNAYHRLLHQRQQALDACGDANAHRCEICHGYTDQADITVLRPTAVKNHRAYHKRCATDLQRQRKLRLTVVAPMGERS